MIKIWNKFRSGYFGLTILSIFGLIAGLSLLIFPENTHQFVIRIVGITWILNGFLYALKIMEKNFKYKIENKNKIEK